MIASKMTAFGLWPGAFSDCSRVQAAGTTLATANVVALADTVIINGGTGGINFSGPGSRGDTMTVVNATAAGVQCYPGQKAGMINGTANPFVVGVNHATTMKCLAPGQWFVTNDVALTGTIPLSDEEEPAASGA